MHHLCIFHITHDLPATTGLIQILIMTPTALLASHRSSEVARMIFPGANAIMCLSFPRSSWDNSELDESIQNWKTDLFSAPITLLHYVLSSNHTVFFFLISKCVIISAASRLLQAQFLWSYSPLNLFAVIKLCSCGPHLTMHQSPKALAIHLLFEILCLF